MNNLTFRLPSVACLLLLSGCELAKLLNNDKCCCLTTQRYFSCSNKAQHDSCQVVIEPGDIDHKEAYNSCKPTGSLLPDRRELLTGGIILAVDAPGSVSSKPIIIDGVDYATSLSALRQSLQTDRLKHSRTSVSDILREVPIDPSNSSAIEALKSRPPVTFTGDTVQSDGKALDVKFTDQRLGSVEIIVPAHLKAKLSGGNDSIRFDFPIPVTVLLQGAASKYGVASNQRLDYIVLSTQSAFLSFHNNSDTGETLSITVKLAPSSQHASLRREQGPFSSTK